MYPKRAIASVSVINEDVIFILAIDVFVALRFVVVVLVENKFEAVIPVILSVPTVMFVDVRLPTDPIGEVKLAIVAFPIPKFAVVINAEVNMPPTLRLPVVIDKATRELVDTSVPSSVPVLIVVDTRLGIVEDAIDNDVAKSVPALIVADTKFVIVLAGASTLEPIASVLIVPVPIDKFAVDTSVFAISVPEVIVVLFKLPTEPDVASKVPSVVVVEESAPVFTAVAVIPPDVNAVFDKLPIVPDGASTLVPITRVPIVDVPEANVAVDTRVPTSVPVLIVEATKLGIVEDAIDKDVAKIVPVLIVVDAKFVIVLAGASIRVPTTRVPDDIVVATRLGIVTEESDTVEATSVPTVIVVLFKFPTEPLVASNVPIVVFVVDKFVPTRDAIVPDPIDVLADESRVSTKRLPTVVVVLFKFPIEPLVASNVPIVPVPIDALADETRVSVKRVPVEIVVETRLDDVKLPAINVPTLIVALFKFPTDPVDASNVPNDVFVVAKFVIVEAGASNLVSTTSAPIVPVLADILAVETKVLAKRVPDEIVVETKFEIVASVDETPPDIDNVDVLKFVVERFDIVLEPAIRVPALRDVGTYRLVIVPAGEDNAVVFINVAIVADVFVKVLTNFTVLLIFTFDK